MAAFMPRWRDSQGALYHGGAVAYAVLAWAGGLAGLLQPEWYLWLPATFMLAHGMIVAAYMVHECGHNIVFFEQAHNTRLGAFLSWLCGACYGRFEDIRYKHFRHHVDNDDVVWFDYEAFFSKHPRVLAITRALEWLYIPAHDLIMHGIMVLTSFVIPQRRDQRVRNVTVLLIRGGLFAALAIYSLRAAILYMLAYLLMMTVLRFMDSLQHDYPYTLTLFSEQPGERRGLSEWEQEHTFSNPHSLRWEKLNWLTLNFGFHNAHHSRPIVPWFRLPALHREIYGDDPTRVIPLWPQLRMFHRHRVDRIVKWDIGEQTGPDPQGAQFLAAARRGEVHGGNAASFLTAF